MALALRLLPSFALLCLPALCQQAPCAAAQASLPGSRPAVDFSELLRGFTDPPWTYAPAMFWFWDVAPPDPDQVEEIARRLVEVGINPGYVHARPPIVPEFPRDPTDPEHPVAQVWLTEAWFAAFDRVVAVAERAGATVGFCDDVWWPSLRAAGRVLEHHPELAAQTLAWSVIEGRGALDLPARDFAVVARRVDEPRVLPTAASQWIGQAQPKEGAHELTVARTFELPPDSRVARAELYLAAAGASEPTLDGFSLGLAAPYAHPRVVDVAALLEPGPSRLEVRVEVDGAQVSGARVELRVEFEDGKTFTLASDGSWSARAESPGGGGVGPWSPAARLDGKALERTLRPALHRTAEIEGASSLLVEGQAPLRWTAPDEGLWRAYVFRIATYADVNRLDRRLGPAFVELALEPYLERYRERLGSTLVGVFVDNEGDYGTKLAWSADLEREYGERTGRDLRLDLPLLLDRDVEGLAPRARCDWFRTVSDLYVANHAAVIERAAHAGLHAIPNFWEESLTVQTVFVGDTPALLRRFTLPGNDCLGLSALDPQPFAEVRSAAEFEGRRLMSEFFGAGRWEHFDPATLKRATNAIHAWGVDHVVPHGLFLNRALTGSGWTPDWYDENPLFRHLGLWADFTRRASFVNAASRSGAKVLLLDPRESVWALLGPGVFDPRLRVGPEHVDALFEPEALVVDRAYAEATRTLSAAWVEFLIGDRVTFEEGVVEDGALHHRGFEFRTVVLPPLVVLSRAVALQLVELARSGGNVLALGPLPRGSVEQGFGDPVLAELMERLVAAPGFVAVPDLAALLEAGHPALEPGARVLAGDGPELVQRRRSGEHELVWLANQTSGTRRFELSVPGAKGRALLLDCERGRVIEIGSSASDSGARVKLELAPYEALWFAFDPTREPLAGRAHLPDPEREQLRLTGPWRVRVEADVQPDVEIRTQVPDALRTPEGALVELATWDTWELLDPRFVGHLDYHTSFELERVPAEPILDLGRVHDMAEVFLNGRRVGARLWPPQRFELAPHLVVGRNELVVRVGNLVQNAYLGTRFGFATPSGLLGPVRLLERSAPGSGE